MKGAVDAFQAAEREQAVQLNVMEEYARRTKASPSNIAAARANVTPPMSPAADATKTKLTKGQRRKALRKKAKMRQQQTEGLAAEAAHDVQSHEVTAAPITEVTECHDEEHAGQEAHDRPLAAFVHYTLAGYGLVLLTSLYVLWVFGRTQGHGLAEMVDAVVVLSFPGAIGAAAARLLV